MEAKQRRVIGMTVWEVAGIAVVLGWPAVLGFGMLLLFRWSAVRHAHRVRKHQGQK